MPQVARLGDLVMHRGLSIVNNTTDRDPSRTGPILTGAATCFANGKPVARFGDLARCPDHGIKRITQTSFPNITVEGKPVAHVGARLECGAVIFTGSENVFVDAGSPGEIVGITTQGSDDSNSQNPGVVPPVWGRAATREEQLRSRALAPEPAGNPTETDDDPAPPTEATPTDCASITEPVPDDFRLSSNFTLAQLSTRAAVSSYRVVANNGLTAAQIVCNLKAVAENVLEPLLRQYPTAFVTSGFRSGAGQSQHGLGQAVDVQFRDVTRGDFRAYYERAQWVRTNLPFDQLILECPGTAWLHISYTSSSLRRDVRSWFGGSSYPAGLILRV